MYCDGIASAFTRLRHTLNHCLSQPSATATLAVPTTEASPLAMLLDKTDHQEAIVHQTPMADEAVEDHATLTDIAVLLEGKQLFILHIVRL
jgi:hypothetical protein